VTDQARLRVALDALRPHLDGPRTQQLEALTQRMAANRLRVLLVGEAKRGKSTLDNVLLGREVLPSGVVPVTAITTTVRVGTPERLEVTYLDGSTRTLPVAELPDQVTEARNPGNRRGAASVTVFLDDQNPDGSIAGQAVRRFGSGVSWLAPGRVRDRPPDVRDRPPDGGRLAAGGGAERRSQPADRAGGMHRRVGARRGPGLRPVAWP
jgi:hypothetical protein